MSTRHPDHTSPTIRGTFTLVALARGLLCDNICAQLAAVRLGRELRGEFAQHPSAARPCAPATTNTTTTTTATHMCGKLLQFENIVVAFSPQTLRLKCVCVVERRAAAAAAAAFTGAERQVLTYPVECTAPGAPAAAAGTSTHTLSRMTTTTMISILMGPDS